MTRVARWSAVAVAAVAGLTAFTPGPRPDPAAAGAVTATAHAGLRIVADRIPYGARRRAEMAAYSRRHSGSATWRLTPSMVVLHYTAGATYAGARATFAADTPNLGERPGTCAHYVVDRDGTVYSLVPATIRCRHTIGLNDRAIGVEMVQPDLGDGGRAADRAILARPRQIRAALLLVKQLQRRFGLTNRDVIGHAMANADPRFHDRRGWRNDHVDWQATDVAEFRRRLDRLG